MEISKLKYLLLNFIFVLILSGCSKEGIYSDKGQVFQESNTTRYEYFRYNFNNRCSFR